MRHRLDPVGIAVMHLRNQGEDTREALLIMPQFVRSDPDSGKVGNTQDVFFRN